MTFRFNKHEDIVEVLDAETNELITIADANDVSAICDEFNGVTNYRYIANQLGITIKEAIERYGHIQ